MINPKVCPLTFNLSYKKKKHLIYPLKKSIKQEISYEYFLLYTYVHVLTPSSSVSAYSQIGLEVSVRDPPLLHRPPPLPPYRCHHPLHEEFIQNDLNLELGTSPLVSPPPHLRRPAPAPDALPLLLLSRPGIRPCFQSHVSVKRAIGSSQARFGRRQLHVKRECCSCNASLSS